MSRKPPVSSANWARQFSTDKVDVYQDMNDTIFFKVVITGQRPKYFYGESSWSDVSRYCSDKLGIWVY